MINFREKIKAASLTYGKISQMRNENSDDELSIIWNNENTALFSGTASAVISRLAEECVRKKTPPACIMEILSVLTLEDFIKIYEYEYENS